LENVEKKEKVQKDEDKAKEISDKPKKEFGTAITNEKFIRN
jgi:hypothetical protein